MALFKSERELKDKNLKVKIRKILISLIFFILLGLFEEDVVNH